jgi:hypothetical protein
MMCPMQIRHRLSYAASPEDVYTMLSDAAFRERVCDAMGVVSRHVEVERGDTGVTVRIEMVQRTVGLPGFATRVVGEETRVVQSERWVAGEGADLELEIPGKPGHIRGRIGLVGSGEGTVETFAGEARIGIPLVGGRLERLIERLFVQGMDTEQAVGRRWLAGDRS